MEKITSMPIEPVTDANSAVFELRVNGRKQVLPVGPNQPLSVREALNLLEYQGRHFAVALNSRFVARAQYEYAQVQSGDELEIVSPMQGG